MKIIQFSDSFLPIRDGVGNVVYQYAVQMSEQGHEVYVVAPQTDTGFNGKYPFEIIDYVGFQFASMKSYKVGFPALDPNCQQRLNMIDADIVHVHTPFTAGQAGIAYAQNHKVPIIGTFHSNYYDDILQVTGMELIATVGSKIVGGFYNKCDEVWSVSKTSRKTLKQYGCIKPVRVMENGTDSCQVSQQDIEKVRQEFGLTERPILLFVGQINWKKNIRCILEAAALLPFPFQLVFAGTGPHMDEIRELAISLGISGRVIFTGFIQEEKRKNALYALADLFVFPSLYDTSGLVVREAAAAGTPSITVQKSGAAECIKDGENGFLCKDSPEDLAAVIVHALEDPQKLQQIGEAAKETIPIPWKETTAAALKRYQYLVENYDPSKKKKRVKKKSE